MAELTAPDLNGVAETLLIPLYVRAIESQRPDALIHDPRAVELVKRIHYDFKQVRMQSHDEVAVLLRLRKFDQLAGEFLQRNPQGVVVHIGCGLDTRFERVDNGRVEWYDMDLPEVITLRQKLIGSAENERCSTLAGSVFEFDWMKRVGDVQRPFLFLAEGVLTYFEEDQVKALVLAIREHFPQAELACDAMTPFAVRMNNLQLSFSRIKARLHWGLKQGKYSEGWAPGIVLLDEWFFFDDPEPRMAPFHWMSRIPLFARSAGIFHYRLG
ncbi:MAG TPA: class I SAM-dependent methyltransferase [Anaerolineaceae bacterium]|nr:class I SAM-dependent methyltransferase [Anaerolineaceae bacterium]